MPYLITIAWYPSAKATEVAEKYLEARKQFPPDRSLTKEVVQVAVTTNKNGINVMSISEVKEGKLEEALTYAGNAMIPYQSIEGFEYKTRIWSTIVEAMELLGMKAPE